MKYLQPLSGAVEGERPLSISAAVAAATATEDIGPVTITTTTTTAADENHRAHCADGTVRARNLPCFLGQLASGYDGKADRAGWRALACAARV
jgi:hypothetical protein